MINSVDCDFIKPYSYSDDYYCLVSDKNISWKQEFKFAGFHEKEKSNKEVNGISFKNCNMLAIPRKLTRAFPNLRFMSICNSSLKSIDNSDLAEYTNLECFYFIGNKIEYLKGNLFEGFVNLKCICLRSNNLKCIEPNIFNEIDTLVTVDLRDNPNYNQCYSSRDDNYFSNVTLCELKSELFILHTLQSIKDFPHDEVNATVTDSFKTSDILCYFEALQLSRDTYNCIIENQRIPENRQLNFIGDHEMSKTNQNVTGIWFRKCFISKVPQGLTKTFPKLRFLSILECNLEEISRSDMAEYRNLEMLYFEWNKIDVLPGDLFTGFRNLFNVSFKANQLTIIDPTLLDGLDKLMFVDLRNNRNENMFYSAYNQSEQCWSLCQIKHKMCQDFLKVVNEKFVECSSEKISDGSKTGESDALSVFENEATSMQQLRIDNYIKNFTKSAAKALKNDEKFRDLAIKVDNHEFRVHKFLLSAHSPKIACLLNRNSSAESLTLTSISADTIRRLISYIYEYKLPVDGDFIELFNASGSFKIKELKNHAGKMLVDRISMENVIKIQRLCNKYGHDELRQKVDKFMRENPIFEIGSDEEVQTVM